MGDPAAARPLPGVSELLARVAGRWGTVAVVSGRPASFLAEHLVGAGRTRLFGLYGLEQVVGGSEVEPMAGAEPWRAVVNEAADRIAAAAPPGVVVERKGLTVTLHYRADPARQAWVEDQAATVGGRLGLHRHPGKMSVELRPPVEVDKGTVVDGLSGGLTAVLFAGDDSGDLPAFDTLARLRQGGRAALAVAVGGPETPQAVIRAAGMVVEGPEGVVAVLRRLGG